MSKLSNRIAALKASFKEAIDGNDKDYVKLGDAMVHLLELSDVIGNPDHPKFATLYIQAQNINEGFYVAPQTSRHPVDEAKDLHKLILWIDEDCVYMPETIVVAMLKYISRHVDQDVRPLSEMPIIDKVTPLLSGIVLGPRALKCSFNQTTEALEHECDMPHEGTSQANFELETKKGPMFLCTSCVISIAPKHMISTLYDKRSMETDYS